MFAESLFLLFGAFAASTAQAKSVSVASGFPIAPYMAPFIASPLRKPNASLAVITTGKAFVLMDGKSGALLSTKNEKTPYPIASLTKLMTAMVVLDGGQSLDEPIELLEEDEPSEGKVVLGRGERLMRRELLEALLIGSVNSAGEALARSFLGGKEAFLKAMNAKAKEMHLSQAVFLDPTGLDRGNVATAQEVATMMRRALQYGHIRDITKKSTLEVKMATGKSVTIQSTNLLLSSFLNKQPYTILAGKTGSLPEAGFCFAQATHNKAGDELITVTLGSETHFSRYQDVKALTAWGFESFVWR